MSERRDNLQDNDLIDIENLLSLLSNLSLGSSAKGAQTLSRISDLEADSDNPLTGDRQANQEQELVSQPEADLARSPRFYDFPDLIDELPFLKNIPSAIAPKAEPTTSPVGSLLAEGATVETSTINLIQELAIGSAEPQMAISTQGDSGDDDAIHALQGILVVPELEDLRNFKVAVEQKLGIVESQVNSPELFDKIKGLENIIADAASGFSELDSKLLELGNIQNTIPEEIAKVRDRIAELEQQLQDPQALVQLLLPIIAEILSLKASQSRDEMCQAIMPIIAEVIFERSQLDHVAMSRAIADLLPSAISSQIINSPDNIAKAIAPEMGSAIREQIRLDRHAIINALAPEMGSAIKRQIELERDSMVDALYPVIGNTISKYFAEAIRSINSKIENTFSPEGIQRKLRAKLQGVSEAELILKESVPYEVQAVFLIHNLSGLIMIDIQQSDVDTKTEPIDADMLAGMLTAIRSFASECISKNQDNSELDAINYSGSKIIIEVAGYCYLAVIVQGEPDAAFIDKVRHLFGKTVQAYGDLFKDFDGDTATIPLEVQTWLQPLIASPKSRTNQKSSLNFLLWGGLLLVGLLAIPIGFYQYFAYRDRQLENHVIEALVSTPELGVYRLYAQVEGDRLTLSGKLPSPYLRDQALQVTTNAAKRERAATLTVNNKIHVVNVPPDPALVAQAVQRLTQNLNSTEGIQIQTQLQSGTVTILGQVEQPQQIPKITQAFSKIAGINIVSNAIAIQLAPLTTRIYFEFLSTTISPQELGKILEVKAFLERYPEYHINIWAKSDNIGDRQINERLSLQRAQTVKDALIQKGIAAQRLHISGIISMPSMSPQQSFEPLARWIEFQTAIKPRSPHQ